jgi:DNA-binding protein HU-beta
MNKKILVDVLAEKTGLQRQHVASVINTFIDTVKAEIASNNKVSMRGFGVFYPVFQNERPVRNPQTGQELMFTPRNSFKFRPGEDVLHELNGQDEENKVL